MQETFELPSAEAPSEQPEMPGSPLLARLRGPRPRAWICVGPGYNREEIKASILKTGHGFTGEAVTTLEEICLRVVSHGRAGPAVTKNELLSPFARQEVLRLILSDRALIRALPEIKRLRRQSGFFSRTDRAIQAGRMAFAHADEEEALLGRLVEVLGENPVRAELRQIAVRYETWLKGSGLWDTPMLLREAIRVLGEGWPARLSKPEEIVLVRAQSEESLEAALWETLRTHVPVIRRGPLFDTFTDMAAPEWFWERWHTVDDAAEALADALSRETDWDKQAVLFPDHPSARRSIRRALEARGVPLADPRDPNLLKFDEAVKAAMLPLEVVARNFERKDVAAFLRAYSPEAFPGWLAELSAFGIRDGLNSYQRLEKLKGASVLLEDLHQRFGGRRDCHELATAHLEYLRERQEIFERAEGFPLIQFFESFWTQFLGDIRRVYPTGEGVGRKRAPLLFWLERLEARLSEMSAPVSPLKPRAGVRIFRLSQAPSESFSEELGTPERVRRLWVLALPPQWLSGEGAGDYWFSGRERDVLAGEFGIRSSASVQTERKATLLSWIKHSDQVAVLDARYDFDGKERESILPVLKEMGAPFASGEDALELGSHPRWVKSYSTERKVQARDVKLSPAAAREISASAVDQYSRCPFQALAKYRWKLWDARDPGTDLWPESRGNLMHAAVRILVSTRTESGFTKSPREALDEAWKETRITGLMRGERLERYVRARLEMVLAVFCEKEREYASRSGTKPVVLDDEKFRLEFEGVTITGKPDRVDEHADGLFVIDYKAGGANHPKGKDVFELGYGLQLPFYALAARKKLGKAAIGAQFVELTRKGGRSSGIFFKRFNGKTEGKLTATTANSKSLLPMEPDDFWPKAEEHLVAHARAFVEGRFEAKPKQGETECKECMQADLCGFRRVIPEISQDE